MRSLPFCFLEYAKLFTQSVLNLLFEQDWAFPRSMYHRLYLWNRYDVVFTVEIVDSVKLIWILFQQIVNMDAIVFVTLDASFVCLDSAVQRHMVELSQAG